MRVRILISLLSLAVIFFGVRYAVGRERLRNPAYLHSLYQETNAAFFDGELPDVALKVEDLSDKNAEGVTYKKSEETFVIALDPQWNTSEVEALDTMRHEACHIATWGDEPDEHGQRFIKGMKRFGKGE